MWDWFFKEKTHRLFFWKQVYKHLGYFKMLEEMGMEKKVKDLKRITKCIRFYSLIYGVFLLIFGFLGVYVVYFSITTFSSPYRTDILVNQLILLISFIISSLLLMVTYFGLSHSKTYARLTGIFGCSLIPIVLIIELLVYNISFTLNSLWPAIIIVFIPSIILIALIAVFWNRLNLEENSK